MIRLVVARPCLKTGAMIEAALLAVKVPVGGPNANALVSYGVRLNTQLPALNAMAGGRTKYEELQALAGGGVRVPWFCRSDDRAAAGAHLPVLARRAMHRGGFDIRLVQTRRGVDNWSAKRDFFVQFVPSDDEYRVQVFRSAHLGTYRKVLLRPQQQRRAVGRNHRNGYGFQLVKEAEVPRGAVELAKKAVGVLGLDFGAVDILHGTDGNYYVLEVNTAPGADPGGQRQWMNSLVAHIKTWVEKGYPGRKQE